MKLKKLYASGKGVVTVMSSSNTNGMQVALLSKVEL
jgi:hypothetical protein